MADLLSNWIVFALLTSSSHMPTPSHSMNNGIPRSSLLPKCLKVSVK